MSTETLDQDLSLPFEFLMDATMLGVGVGFDTKGAGKLTILVQFIECVVIRVGSGYHPAPN